jgi:hypothetical protein
MRLFRPGIRYIMGIKCIVVQIVRITNVPNAVFCDQLQADDGHQAKYRWREFAEWHQTEGSTGILHELDNAHFLAHGTAVYLRCIALGRCERLQRDIIVAVYCRESALNGPFVLGQSNGGELHLPPP